MLSVNDSTKSAPRQAGKARGEHCFFLDLQDGPAKDPFYRTVYRPSSLCCRSQISMTQRCGSTFTPKACIEALKPGTT